MGGWQAFTAPPWAPWATYLHRGTSVGLRRGKRWPVGRPWLVLWGLLRGCWSQRTSGTGRQVSTPPEVCHRPRPPRRVTEKNKRLVTCAIQVSFPLHRYHNTSGLPHLRHDAHWRWYREPKYQLCNTRLLFYLPSPFQSYELKTLTQGISFFQWLLNSDTVRTFYISNPEIIHLDINLPKIYLHPFLVFLSDDLSMHTKLALLKIISC